MTLGLALLAALVFGGGVALQQREAANEPSRLAARPSLLIRLAQRPLWLFGLGADVIGFGLQALALRRGSLVVVQPLITTSLLFTLLFIAALDKVEVSRANWVAVVGVLCGLSIFLAVARPTEESRAAADGEGWLLVVVAIAVLVVTALAVGFSHGGAIRSAAFGLAAGSADALMAVLAKAFAGSFDAGLTKMITSWTPYALVGGGIAALLLTSTAYQAGHPTLSLPVITVSDPLFGCIIGVLLFGEQVHLEGWRGPVVGLAVALLVIGLVSLGRDDRVAGRAANLDQVTA